MQIVIKKAAIRGSLFLSYEFEQTELDVKNTIKTSSDAPIHDDLRIAFRKLIPHFTFICEEVKDEKLVAKAIKSYDNYLSDKESAVNDTFFKYRVHEFNIVEKDGDEKVFIKGSKQLETLKEISFSTPGTSLYDDDYKFRSELNEIIEELKDEVTAYMQGKTAPKAQTEMSFGDEDDEDDSVKKSVDKLKKTLKDKNISMEVVTSKD